MLPVVGGSSLRYIFRSMTATTIAATLIGLYVINDQWAFRCQRVGRGILLLDRDSAAAYPGLAASIMPGRYIASVWIGRLLFGGAVVAAWRAWGWFGVVPLLAYVLLLGTLLDVVSPWPSYRWLLRLFEERIHTGAAGAEAMSLLPTIDHLRRELEAGGSFEAVTTGAWLSRAGDRGRDLSDDRTRVHPQATAVRQLSQPSAMPATRSAPPPPMTAKRAIKAIIAELTELDVHMSGDDSPLANPWEEIKDQLQNEPSFHWDAYLDLMRQFVSGFVADLNERDREDLRESLKCSSLDRVESKLLRRLLARGKKEAIEYVPFDFEYFTYPLLDFTVYGQVITRTGLDQCNARVFSKVAARGELGTVDCAQIEDYLSRTEFEEARAKGWPVIRS
jgi:hypothetical protein